MPVETEIKFRIDDQDGLTHRLKAAGFTLHTPRSFETNVLYDTPDRRLRSRTEILRIRNYAGRCLLTHKRLPDPGVPGERSFSPGWDSGPGEDTHKHRIETETEISDGPALAQVFHSIGLEPAFRYEKWRTKWTDGQGHCDIDETPIGNFAELEGSPQWIDATAARLGIVPSQYITLSYGRLFDLWREQHNSPAQHLTFAACSR
ncbi:MAG: class IV adenylate cyclase [Terracidiphilus sp.]|jgi:adenylate cyclase class 2